MSRTPNGDNGRNSVKFSVERAKKRDDKDADRFTKRIQRRICKVKMTIDMPQVAYVRFWSRDAV